ncbi:hypothetical protein FVQ98_15630 [Ottowia sp. GY511]|nr:hypothetical protein FVQ98_15630 [Ottowia sp. GY511]
MPVVVYARAVGSAADLAIATVARHSPARDGQPFQSHLAAYGNAQHPAAVTRVDGHARALHGQGAVDDQLGPGQLHRGDAWRKNDGVAGLGAGQRGAQAASAAVVAVGHRAGGCLRA